MPIEFGPLPSRGTLDRWMATMTRAEVVAYAERKMMPTRFMLRNWKAARKCLRKREPKS
jgi:hypothetical protein